MKKFGSVVPETGHKKLKKIKFIFKSEDCSFLLLIAGIWRAKEELKEVSRTAFGATAHTQSWC